MGNCLSSSKLTRGSTELSHARLIGSGKATFLDATEPDTSTGTDLDVTLPLSPFSPPAQPQQQPTTTASKSHNDRRFSGGRRGGNSSSDNDDLPLPSLNISPVSFPPASSPQSPQERQQLHRRQHPRPFITTVSSSSSMSIYTSTSATSTSSSPKRNRALQARLEKARSIQLALNSSPHRTSSTNALVSPDHSNNNNHQQWGVATASTIAAAQSTPATPMVTPEEFQATFDASTIWGALHLDSNATALALSRPTNPYQNGAINDDEDVLFVPPWLILVSGTDTGSVQLTSLYEPQYRPPPLELSSPPSFSAPQTSTITLCTDDDDNDPYTIRAVAIDPTCTFVAVGGDNCQCTIYQLVWKKSSSHRSRHVSQQQHKFHNHHHNHKFPSIVEVDEDDRDGGGRASVVLEDEGDTQSSSTSSFGDEYDGGIAVWLESTHVVGQISRVDRIYDIQFSPNGQYVTIGGFDGTVAIVSRCKNSLSKTAEWQLVTEIGRDGLVYSLDWSFDNRYLAIAGTDKTLAIVDTHKSWKIWKEVKTGLTVAQSVQFRPNSYSLAVAGSEVVIIKEWTVKHHIPIMDSTEATSQNTKSNNQANNNKKLYKINSLSWSPTGTYLVLVDSDNACRLLETTGYSVVHELHRSQPLHSVVWGEQPMSSASSLLSLGNVGGSGGGAIFPRRYIFVGGNGTQSQVVILKAGLEFHASSALSVNGGGDDHSFSTALSTVSSIHTAASAMSTWILKDNVFRDVEEVLDLSSSRVVVDKEHVVAVCFSRGSRTRSSTFLAYSLDDGRVIVRSTIGDWHVVAELLFSKPIKCLEFSLGSRYLALGSAESRVHVVETAPSWTIVARHDFFAPINAVGFSRRNERLAVGVSDGILALFDPQDDYASVGEIDVSDSAVLSLDWSTKNFAIGRDDGTISIYDASQVCSNFCVPLVEHELCSPVHDVAFGPNSRFVAAGAHNGLVNVYSAKGGWVLCHQVRGPTGLSSMCWNSSGRLLSLGGKEGQVKMVDTIFWADVEELDALVLAENSEITRAVSSMAFDQSGTMFAFVAPDGDGIRVVDTNKWKIVFSHRGDTGDAAGEVSSVSSY